MTIWIRHATGIIKMDSIDSFDFNAKCEPHGVGKWEVHIKWLAISHVKDTRTEDTNYVLAETSLVVKSEEYPDDELYHPQVFDTLEALLSTVWVEDGVNRHIVYNAADTILGTAPEYFTEDIVPVYRSPNELRPSF